MIRDLDLCVAMRIHIKRYVSSFKRIVQMEGSRQSGKVTLRIIEKALGLIDKSSNRVSVRRHREPLRKPTVSGDFSIPHLRICTKNHKIHTKRYHFCFKGVIQIDGGAKKQKSASHGGCKII